MSPQERMMAALEQARTETAQQLVAETEALMPALKDAAKRGIHDVSALVPAWIAKAGSEASMLPVSELMTVFEKAYAQQHTARLTNVSVPYGAAKTATAAALARRLGIDLRKFVEDFWRDAFSFYLQRALPH